MSTTTQKPASVGVIGCGNICGIYFEKIAEFGNLTAGACADLDLDRATAKAEEFGVPKACTVDELLADDDIDVIVNLTIPAAHAEIAVRALENGKHVYNEKPLGVSREDGQAILDAAAARNLRVGCAPDTFLGAGYQTCRGLIDEGKIGTPIAATVSMMSASPTPWHPDPYFFLQPGAGPVFDMGPYYLTALVHLLGPIKSITGITARGFSERTVGSGPKEGQVIPVNIDTTVMGALEFVSGAVANLLFSFDIVGGHHQPCFEVHGTGGSMGCPDPNTFGGPISLKLAGEKEWTEAEVSGNYTENSRGLGLSDMMAGEAEGRAHRASGELAMHVLDAMHAFYDAGATGKRIDLATTCAQPAPLE